MRTSGLATSAFVRSLGFRPRIRGGHYIFSRDGVAEILNLKPRGDKAKAYQVKQVRTVIVSYNLAGESDPAEDASQTTSEGEHDG